MMRDDIIATGRDKPGVTCQSWFKSRGLFDFAVPHNAPLSTHFPVIFAQTLHYDFRNCHEAFNLYRLSNLLRDVLYHTHYLGNHRFFYLAPVCEWFVQVFSMKIERDEYQYRDQELYHYGKVNLYIAYCCAIAAVISFFCIPGLGLATVVLLTLGGAFYVTSVAMDFQRYLNDYLSLTAESISPPPPSGLEFFDRVLLTQWADRVGIVDNLGGIAWDAARCAKFNLIMAALLLATAYLAAHLLSGTPIYIILYAAAGCFGVSVFLGLLLCPCVQLIQNYMLNDIKKIPAPFIQEDDANTPEKNAEIRCIHRIWNTRHAQTVSAIETARCGCV